MDNTALEPLRHTPSCNLCGSTEFNAMGRRENAQCSGCGSLERTRAMMLILQEIKPDLEGCRVLHFAPERALTRYFLDKVGAENYHAADIAPEDYAYADTQQFDLCSDLFGLEPSSYDLIIHSHVLEHVPCNYAAVMYGLHRALKPDGLQLCCIPFETGAYREDCSHLSKEERVQRFGQRDHYRRFGIADLQLTIGMMFDIPETYDLEDEFSADELDSYNIPEHARKGFNPSTVLSLRKHDLRLA